MISRHQPCISTLKLLQSTKVIKEGNNEKTAEEFSFMDVDQGFFIRLELLCDDEYT